MHGAECSCSLQSHGLERLQALQHSCNMHAQSKHITCSVCSQIQGWAGSHLMACCGMQAPQRLLKIAWLALTPLLYGRNETGMRLLRLEWKPSPQHSEQALQTLDLKGLLPEKVRKYRHLQHQHRHDVRDSVVSQQVQPAVSL